MNDNKLKLLLLEDSAIDAELNERILRKAGLEFNSLRVEHENTFSQALDEFNPDIILADYHLPTFNGLKALAIARNRDKDVPFIFVTGAMGEERAIESLHLGADDYIIKDRINRLAPAVKRVLDDREKQQKLQQSEEALHLSQSRYLTASNTIQDAFIIIDDQQKVLEWNPAAERIFGYTKDEVTGHNLHDLLAPKQHEKQIAKGFSHFIKHGEGPAIGKTQELIALHKDGHQFPVELSLSGTRVGSQWHAVGLVRDITDRYKSRQILEESEARYRQLINNMSDGVTVYKAIDDGQDFVIQEHNRAGELVTCTTHSQVIGKRLTEVFPGVKKWVFPAFFNVSGKQVRQSMLNQDCIRMIRLNVGLIIIFLSCPVVKLLLFIAILPKRKK